MSARVTPVILSGGSGTRLWPLSRQDRPKQFLPLVPPETLFQQTLLRLRALPAGTRPPVVVCNAAHRFLVAEQLREIGVEAQTIMLEPAARNTAPAVAAAALLVAMTEPPKDEILLVLPADHVIRDPSAFIDALEHAVAAARGGRLVTFGIVPDRAETGYGYVKQGRSHGGWAELEQFVEKPDRQTAEGYVRSGGYLWNSGMFVFSAEAYLAELGEQAPEMVTACRAAVAEAEAGHDFTRLGEAFVDCPADSIDYAVMEKTANAAVVPLDCGWSDLGSWPALHEVLDNDASGNAFHGNVIADVCRNSYVRATHRLVAAIGLDDIVVVETDDAVLVLKKPQSQSVKALVDGLDDAYR